MNLGGHTHFHRLVQTRIPEGYLVYLLTCETVIGLFLIYYCNLQHYLEEPTVYRRSLYEEGERFRDAVVLEGISGEHLKFCQNEEANSMYTAE